MRWAGVVAALTVLGLAAPVRSDEIYRWIDERGTLNYSNTPTADVSARRLSDAVPAEGEPPAEGQDTAALSAQASLHRNALERDLRATQKRLHDVDARLAFLGRARTQNARGSAATGGIGTLAVDVRSEEERGLAAEREELAKHVDEIHEDATKLRDELTARLGTTPTWWNDPR